MADFQKIDVNELNESAFRLIGKDWMLICAETDGKVNMMTASWGGVGVMWNEPVAIALIRPQRYTKGFVDKEDRFTLSFYGEEYREMLKFCGSASGRDVDKVKETHLTPVALDGATTFAEARLTLVCKKLFVQDMDEASFLDKSIVEKMYNGDFHTMYIAKIESAYAKKS